jgi:hypothetical protein
LGKEEKYHFEFREKEKYQDHYPPPLLHHSMGPPSLDAFLISDNHPSPLADNPIPLLHQQGLPTHHNQPAFRPLYEFLI